MTTTTLTMRHPAHLETLRTDRETSTPESSDVADLTRDWVLEQVDPGFAGSNVELRRGTYLADQILALDEPWRRRFVALIARRAERAVMSTEISSRTQLALWLADPSLARVIRLMLRAWLHEA